MSSEGTGAGRWAGLLDADPPVAPPGRPWVRVNMVTSLDGRAARDGRTAPLSSDADQELMRELRARADAVLVGASTLAAERYGSLLDERGRRARAEAGRPPLPLAVTASRRGVLPLDIPLTRDAGQRMIAFVGATPAGELPASLQVVETDPDGLPASLLPVLRREHGVEMLLCEGGPRLLGALLGAGVVDELFLTLAPWIAGGDEPAIVEAGELVPMPGGELVAQARAGDHLMLRYRIVQRPPRSGR